MALVTVKKRWKSVYVRAEAALPALLSEAASPTARRWTEKKRHLLNYLRHHLEDGTAKAAPAAEIFGGRHLFVIRGAAKSEWTVSISSGRGFPT